MNSACADTPAKGERERDLSGPSSSNTQYLCLLKPCFEPVLFHYLVKNLELMIGERRWEKRGGQVGMEDWKENKRTCKDRRGKKDVTRGLPSPQSYHT